MTLVELPAEQHWSLLDHHRVNPPRLAPGTYAIDAAAYGRDQIVGTFVLSPGDVRGTRFVHDLVLTGCWSLVGWQPCMACEGCGALVASRTDDCESAQEARLGPTMVVRESCDQQRHALEDPFEMIADWDSPPPDTRQWRWHPKPTRPQPALRSTRWGGHRLKADLYRDDPPA